ncbi:MAG: HDOD domain-containing protein [Lachnospiraceae bacterium]|nr:HDOD domain-containing protein [Lachnospiraceae bacterium]
MFATLIPLFDENMAVKAFSLFAQKENFLLNPFLLGTGRNTGIGRIDGLEVIESTGISTLSPDADIFVPVNHISLFADIEFQCKAPTNRIVILLDNSVRPENSFIARIKELRNDGYRFAIRKLFVSDFEAYRDIIRLMDYILLDYKRIDISKAKIYFGKLFPDIKLVACNVDSQEVFDRLKDDGGYSLYEGDFYRLPITKGDTDIAPVKATMVELLNIVNDPDFDLEKAADVIGRDTSLVVSLLKMVNKMTINGGITTIRHAAAMLGQKELKRWINTAVTDRLCEDKPSEIMRLSLIRAKFAENLASTFNMAMQTSELFLMGLFSVLDIILNKPMSEALTLVKVAKPIEDALTKNSGPFADVMDFIRVYEVANWTEVSRRMVVSNIDMNRVYDCYLEALSWYRDLFND